jgi:hypothetical protein
MERGVNQCGISQSASFPTGAASVQPPKAPVHDNNKLMTLFSE